MGQLETTLGDTHAGQNPVMAQPGRDRRPFGLVPWPTHLGQGSCATLRAVPPLVRWAERYTRPTRRTEQDVRNAKMHRILYPVIGTMALATLAACSLDSTTQSTHEVPFDGTFEDGLAHAESVAMTVWQGEWHSWTRAQFPELEDRDLSTVLGLKWR